MSEEYNRVSEGYELFLTSKKPKEEELKLDYLVNQKVEVYNKDGIKISLNVSRYVNPGKCVKVTVIFEKENIEAPVNYSFKLGGEFFKSVFFEDGNEQAVCGHLGIRCIAVQCRKP